MSASVVQKIRLIPDRYNLPNVGQLENGNYYWIDIQLHSDGSDTRDFIAVYQFNADGEKVEHEIIDLGLRSAENFQSIEETIVREQRRIGIRNRSAFWVRPFSIEAYGFVFGLVVRKRALGEIEGYQAIDAMPGWTMMFYPPWEDGFYDT